jgi:hypothetical protein
MIDCSQADTEIVAASKEGDFYFYQLRLGHHHRYEGWLQQGQSP